jgi:endonuclease/exonuclease/phosphatase family metal-dependent hydrolase
VTATRLRLVTLNLWGTEPPLERRLALADRQLAALDADVIALQEVKPHGDATTAHALAARRGDHVLYVPALQWDDGAFGPGSRGGEEGLALVSRWPMLARRARRLPEVRPTEARLLLSAQLATPAGPIWVHTTHLHYRLDDGAARAAQMIAIDETIRRCGRGNDDPPQLLCGDFNATPDSDEVRFLRGLTSLAGRRTHFQDAWRRCHDEPGRAGGPADGITWSADNAHTRPLRSLDLDRRIDYVFVTTRKKDGRGTVHDCRVVLTERDGDDAICASDHYAVCADVQIAAG